MFCVGFFLLSILVVFFCGGALWGALCAWLFLGGGLVVFLRFFFSFVALNVI